MSTTVAAPASANNLNPPFVVAGGASETTTQTGFIRVTAP